MAVAEFLEVTSRFAPNSYYYTHPTDLPLASMWNTTAWITDPSLLSTVSVKVGCRKQVIVGTYHGFLAAKSAEISELRGEETPSLLLQWLAVTGKSQLAVGLGFTVSPHNFNHWLILGRQPLSFKTCKNNGYFTWRPDNISMNYSRNEKCLGRKLYRKSYHVFLNSVIFPRNYAVYEKMFKSFG